LSFRSRSVPFGLELLYQRDVTQIILVVLLALPAPAILAGCRSEKGKEGKSGMEENSFENNDTGSSECGLPLNDSELKELLTPEQYRIIRQNGTEQPFANEYWDRKEPGLYVDRVSKEPLFLSRDKYDSGTGWPSFTRPIDDSCLKEISDRSHRMVRTEVRSARSDSHLGHVFDDGPGPGGRRYCINSASLHFVPVHELEAEGYGEYLHFFKERSDSEAREKSSLRKAAFGAGCFWGVEASFREKDGVIDTAVGYAGGSVENPTYPQVCTGRTGHAEVVEVIFDPARVTFERLLDLFWQIHNPTTLNRQGPDIGTQYRSVIFFHDEKQEAAARASLEKIRASGRFKKEIVTEIVPASVFYRAEEYHQRYVEKHGTSSCRLR